MADVAPPFFKLNEKMIFNADCIAWMQLEEDGSATVGLTVPTLAGTQTPRLTAAHARVV